MQTYWNSYKWLSKPTHLKNWWKCLVTSGHPHHTSPCCQWLLWLAVALNLLIILYILLVCFHHLFPNIKKQHLAGNVYRSDDDVMLLMILLTNTIEACSIMGSKHCINNRRIGSSASETILKIKLIWTHFMTLSLLAYILFTQPSFFSFLCN